MGLLVFLVAVLVPAVARAAAPDLPVTATGGVIFDADVVPFFGPDGRTRARIFVEVPHRSLRFTRDREGWGCRLEVTVIAYDRGGNQLNGDLWTQSVRSATPSGSADASRRIYELEVGPGRMDFEIKVSQVGSGRTGVWKKEVEVPRYEIQPLSMSGLVFGRCDLDSTALDPAWSRGNFFPVPRRRYGETRPVACVYGEIYDRVPSSDSVYAVSYRVIDGSGKTRDSWDDAVERIDGRGVFILHPSVADLSLGSYRLRVDVKVGEVRDQAERSFEVDETRFNLFDDRQMVRGVLSYVATNEELLVLENLPSDSLSGFWDDFWRRRDPAPEAPGNENLTEFVRRVQYANANFSILGSGWNSDMGRIYIRYGQPDQIDRSAFSSGGPPREIWTYLDRNRQFIFADTDGFGRYRLVGSER